MAENQVPNDVPVVLPAEVPGVQEAVAIRDQDEANINAPDAEAPQDQGHPQPGEAEDELKALKAEVEALKASRAALGGVDAALQLVRQLASAPARLRDPTMITSALQSLSDEARCANHPQAAEFEAILRQTRPFIYRPEFGDIIIRLVGTKEETSVARTIAKMIKSPRQPMVHPYRRQMGARGATGRTGRSRMVCFSCGRPGHFQRHCPANT